MWETVQHKKMDMRSSQRAPDCSRCVPSMLTGFLWNAHIMNKRRVTLNEAPTYLESVALTLCLDLNEDETHSPVLLVLLS